MRGKPRAPEEVRKGNGVCGRDKSRAGYAAGAGYEGRQLRVPAAVPQTIRKGTPSCCRFAGPALEITAAIQERKPSF